MNLAADLMGILAEWRRLTEREAQAILTDDWENVAAQQQQKLQLHEAIARALESAHGGRTASPLAGGGNDLKLNAVVTELVALETRNRDTLAAKRQSRQAEFEHLNETARNLHSVRRTYGGIRSHRWHSYS